MRQSRYLILAALAGLTVAGLACTQKAADETFADATREVAERTADKTKEIVGKTADKTTEIAGDIAGDIATKTKELSATTGEAITDAWITTKVSAKFLDETLLNGSNINVDTDNHVVTLRGTVASAAAKTRAAAIASGTEGVTRVVNQLVVT